MAAEAGVITLEQAVDIAFENNLSLKAAYEDYDAAKWGLRSARASLLPSVHLTSTVTRVDRETYRRANASLEFIEEFGVELEPFMYETTYSTGLSATMPIFNGGRLWGAVGMAGASRDAALHACESMRRQVKADAKAACFDVLRTEALVGVARDAVGVARSRVETARRMVEVGLRSRGSFFVGRSNSPTTSGRWLTRRTPSTLRGRGSQACSGCLSIRASNSSV